jgi:hypothetical protein
VSGKRPVARYKCWVCGGTMRKRRRVCAGCQKKRPGAVKATMATISKGYGGAPPLVRVKPGKPPRPRCTRCGKKSQRGTSACAACGEPFSPLHEMSAGAAEKRYKAAVVGTPEWWEARAAGQDDADQREHMRAEAEKVRQARGSGAVDRARLLVKGASSRTLLEAYLQERDPLAERILKDVLDRRRS